MQTLTATPSNARSTAPFITQRLPQRISFHFAFLFAFRNRTPAPPLALKDESRVSSAH
jgi:hypothetical protein